MNSVRPSADILFKFGLFGMMAVLVLGFLSIFIDMVKPLKYQK